MKLIVHVHVAEGQALSFTERILLFAWCTGGHSGQGQWSLTGASAPAEGFRFGASVQPPAQHAQAEPANPFNSTRPARDGGNDMETGA
jgi:hypothetical protein